MMPLTVQKRAGRFRLVEARTGALAKNAKGNAIDGGGHVTEKEAKVQVTAINLSKHRRGK